MKEKAINKKELKEYHSIKYLKKVSNGEHVVFILPNGKEIEINGKK